MTKYIMALDQGTTSSRAILFDKFGQIVAKEQQEFTQYFPHPTWVEHDPIEIYESQLLVMKKLLNNFDINDIDSIGITNQRETTIVWHKDTGKPIYNAIVWQCRRSYKMIEQIKNDKKEQTIINKTGLIPDAYFSATKIAWLLDNIEGARDLANSGKLLFGTVDSWLVYNLTRGKIHVTDYSNASRTMLFNIHDLSWDQDLLDYFNIPKSMLPKVYPSSHLYGYIDESIFGKKIAIASIAGDQQAALFGQCCFEPGEAKNTYGTGCFLLMNTGKERYHSKHGLITTIAASVNDDVDYAIEGSIFMGGAIVQWLRDGLKIIEDATSTDKIASSVNNSDGVVLVPAFAGLGAPYWDSEAPGTLVGLSRGTSKEHIVRAALEAIALQSNDVLKAIEEDTNISLKGLRVDGGASHNNFLMQFQSDISSCPVTRVKVVETTALGAAYLAGLATGFYKSINDLKNNHQIDTIFNTKMDEATRNNKLKEWSKAINFVLKWKEL